MVEWDLIVDMLFTKRKKSVKYKLKLSNSIFFSLNDLQIENN